MGHKSKLLHQFDTDILFNIAGIRHLAAVISSGTSNIFRDSPIQANGLIASFPIEPMAEPLFRRDRYTAWIQEFSCFGSPAAISLVGLAEESVLPFSYLRDVDPAAILIDLALQLKMHTCEVNRKCEPGKDTPYKEDS